MNAIADAVEQLAQVVHVLEQGGDLVALKDLDEATLQRHVLRILRARGVSCEEGTEIGGGETDLVLPGRLVIENKVHKDPTRKPFAVKLDAAWQARRYALAANRHVVFVVLAYRPADEGAILPPHARIRVAPVAGAMGDFAEVRVVLPWGQPPPHLARRPDRVPRDAARN